MAKKQLKEKQAIYNFTKKFAKDAKTWDKATDEIVDLHKFMFEEYNENASNKVKFNWKKKSVNPSEFNTRHVNGVRKILKKMNEQQINETYIRFQEWFENKQFAGGGSITSEITAKENEITEFEEVLAGTTDKEEREVIEEGLESLKKELSELKEKKEETPVKSDKKAVKVDKKDEKGRGWGNLKKGKQINKISEFKIGSLYLQENIKFNSKNIMLITNGDETGLKRDIIYATYVRPNNLKKGEGSFAIWGHELEQKDNNKYFEIKNLKEEKKSEPTSTEIKEGEKVQSVGKVHELRKLTDSVYIIKHKDKKHAEMEINKVGGKWKVTCLTSEDKTFDSLQDAVAHITKTLYSGELREYKQAEIAKNKAVKERLEKRAKAGKPANLTPTEAAEKGVAKAIDKIEIKADKGKSVAKDISGVLNNIRNEIKDLKQFKAEIDKKAIRRLIAVLEGFLK